MTNKLFTMIPALKSLKAAIVAAIIGIATTTPSTAAIFNPETFTLDNGMQVVVITNARAPVVQHMVWYKVGAADEGPGESGIAHFLEHLMFKGTERFPGSTFSDTIARNGGRENAFTSFDYTAYFQTISRDRLPMMMEMEADRMTNLTLTDKEIVPERDVVLEERRQRVDSTPRGILGEQAAAVSYLNYPYRRPVIGWAHEIAALDRERIIAFYKRWYAPNNAILVVEGDITIDELRPLAEKTYGMIPRGADIERARVDEPPQTAERRISYTDVRVRQPSWSRSYLASSYHWGDSENAESLEVAAEVLGGSASSKLYRKLVIESGIALSAGAYYSADAVGPGRFGVYASPKPGVTMGDLEAAVDAVLADFMAEGVNADDVERAKDRMQTAAIFARDNFGTGARAFGAALSMGGAVNDVETWPNRIAAVTPDAINAAIKMTLSKAQSVTALLLAPEVN